MSISSNMHKKMLFITEPLYQYGMKIRRTLEEINGEAIDYLEVYYSGISNLADRESVIKRTYRKVFKSNAEEENRTRQRNFFKAHSTIRYDIIIVLLQDKLCIDLFSDFIKNQHSAKKILYVWDDIARIKRFSEISVLFDKVLSFDKFDCKKYSLVFRPLFYADEYEYKNEDKDIDFSLIGTLHSDRAKIVEAIVKQFPKQDYKWEVKLVAGTETIIKDCIKRGKMFRKPFYYTNSPISMSVSANIVKRSKIAIDVPMEGQTGLTMRTIECLAAKTKLVTTNMDITNYDFYDEHNILVIDRDNPMIPMDFFRCGYHDLNWNITNKYSIKSWAIEVLGGRE